MSQDKSQGKGGLLLSQKQLIERWDVSVYELNKMRSRGEGPAWIKFPNGRIRYRLADILAAEAMSLRGFTWDRLQNALLSYPSIANEVEGLMKFLRKTLMQADPEPTSRENNRETDQDAEHLTVPEAKPLPPDQIFLTPEELARRHRTTVESLGNQRYRGEGPPFVKMTGKILYRLSDLLEAERSGTKGFTWARVEQLLERYPGLEKREAAKIVEYLKRALME